MQPRATLEASSLWRSIQCWLVLLFLAVPAIASDDAVTPRYEEGVVLVRFSPILRGAMADFVASRHRASIEWRNLALDYSVLRLEPGQTVEAALEGLKRDPAVIWAEANGYYQTFGRNDIPQDPMLVPLQDRLPPLGQNQWGIFHCGIPWLWRQGGPPGDGVIVAVVDTGLDNFTSPHADLAANIHPTGYDFVQKDSNPTDEGANRGHGTHVAGIVAAASNDQGVAGVAYGAKVMVVRVMDCTAGPKCPGTFSNIARGIQYAADHGARVINLSLGGSDSSQVVRTAVQYAIGKGDIVVAASGNDSATVVSLPAGYPEVIAVGATDSLNHVAIFSNSGENLDLVAPGRAIWSTYPSPSYKKLSGTSMATPFVAGVAAIVAGRNPSLKPLEMERYLKRHCLPLEGADADRDGSGLLSYLPLQDWSDLPPPYPAARHDNFAWEWLGRDASGELSVSDPLDTDFRPNIGGSHHTDGHDDGLFPHSFVRLPFTPTQISPLLATVDAKFSVSRHDGPRYGGAPARQLHFDLWMDWNSNLVFEDALGEHPVNDHIEDPTTWTGNEVTQPINFGLPAGHVLGNPLNIRARLAYGASATTPDSAAKHGEVEDYSLVNFAESFDVVPFYTLTTGWAANPDPSGPCEHHGSGRFASVGHPRIGPPCNGAIEGISILRTPTMNWKEFTQARLRYWHCHSAPTCSGLGHFCRVRIDVDGVKTDLAPIPLGMGDAALDLTPYVGHDAVFIEFIEETDYAGFLCLDDVQVWAYDDDRPSAGLSLSLTRDAGSDKLRLVWLAPRDNEASPTPPTERQTNVYDVRYATAPLAGETAWASALRIDPRDVPTGAASLQPDAAGSEDSAEILPPSAYQGYHVGIRTMDEVTNLSLVGTAAPVAGAPTPGVAVQPPAPVVAPAGALRTGTWQLSNTGNAPDGFAVTAVSASGWELGSLPDFVSLDPGATTNYDLDLQIPPGASGGEADTVTLTATSLTDVSVFAEAQWLVTVEGGPPSSIGDGDAPVLADDLKVLTANPIQAELALEVQVRATCDVSVRVIGADGRVVRTLADGTREAGRHRLAWNRRSNDDERVASGLYFVEARIGETRLARRVMLLK